MRTPISVFPLAKGKEALRQVASLLPPRTAERGRFWERRWQDMEIAAGYPHLSASFLFAKEQEEHEGDKMVPPRTGEP